MKIKPLAFIIAMASLLAASTALAQDQKAGQELVFPNVEQVQKRPSDVHIGSDPAIRSNPENQQRQEQQMKGTDPKGYDKDVVGPDQEIREEKTEYKVIKKGKDAPAEESAPPARWGQ